MNRSRQSANLVSDNNIFVDIDNNRVGIGTTNPVSKLDVSGAVTVSSNLDVSGITTSSQTRFLSVAEKLVRVDGNAVSIAYTTTGANVGYCTNPSGNITLEVTNIPTDSSLDNHIISFSVVINQTGTARSCTDITMNGVTKTIKWAGGSLGSAIVGVTTTNGYDIYSFTGINTVGSANTTDNYEVLGVVNGGFR